MDIILYNAATKSFLLSLHIFIWTYPLCFDVTKFPYETSIYLSLAISEPDTKSEISGVMWQVVPESKIQLVSCELSPKYLLGLSTLEGIHAIGVYILCDLCHSVLFSDYLYFFFDLNAQVLSFTRSSELYFTTYLVSDNLWSSDHPIYIWISYLAFDCSVQYVFWGVTWVERWIVFLIYLSIYMLL